MGRQVKRMVVDPVADVVYVDHFGRAAVGRWPASVVLAGLRAAEAARVAAIIAAATPPERCSSAIPVAPARLRCIAEVPRETVMTENGPRVRRSAPVGEDRVRIGDAFDEMEDQARRRHAHTARTAEAKGMPVPAFDPPFSPGQVSAGRDYATLVERVAASGVKCSSLEALGARSGGGDREEAIFRDFRRLRALERRIGDGLAREVRRIRPGGRKRTAIRVRVLVDQVCLGGMTVSEVLRAHGWSHKDPAIRDCVVRSLRAALDRMRGYDLAQPQDNG